MKDIIGKFSALLLLVSAGFNVYIGVNIPLLQATVEKLGSSRKATDLNDLPLMSILVSAALYGLIGLILLFKKSTGSLNMIMAVLLFGMASLHTYNATKLYPGVSFRKEFIGGITQVVEERTDENTADDYTKAITATFLYPAYASIFGAVAGFLSGVLLLKRK